MNSLGLPDKECKLVREESGSQFLGILTHSVDRAAVCLFVY